MPPTPVPQDGSSELVPLNAIRVETSLSRYPIHRLAKKGSVSIDLREENERGQTTLRWEVTHNSKFGQPGPLAYKLDTLLVNRRIEEASRPVPRIIRLGSLHDICREIGVSEGKSRDNIKRSLYQNASAFITAKIRHKLADGTEQTLEAGFNRYNVVFTGEKLPDGRNADGVYLVLSDIYMQVIDGAMTRPLDYDYLKELPPGAQRFYELLSFQVYAALKHGRQRAKLVYSEYCTYAPQTRYPDFDHVKKQMHKVHAPHRKSGYIESVEYEATTDKDGQPDWLMLYVPGPKAKAEFRTFTKKGGPAVLEVEASPTPLFDQAQSPSPLERELIALGVTPATAAELVGHYPEEHIRAQLEQLQWRAEKKAKKPSDPAAFLVDAIRKGYAAPKGFESKAELAKREEAKREQERKESESRRVKEEARRRDQEAQAKIDAYLNGLTTTERERFDAEALAAADSESRTNVEQASSPTIRRLYQRFIRDAHARRRLGLPPATDG